MKLTTAYFSLVILLISSCSKAPVIAPEADVSMSSKRPCTPHSQTPQQQYLPQQVSPFFTNDNNICNLFPIDNDNYWIYSDSVFNANGTLRFVRIDSVYFQKSFLTTDNIVFWGTGSFDTSASSQVFRGGIYSTDNAVYYSLNGMMPGALYTEKRYYIPEQDSVLETNYTVNDYQFGPRQIKKNAIVKTSAGSFTNALHIKFYTPNVKTMEFTEYFVPGIGVVKREQRNYIAGPQAGLINYSRRELLRYKVD